MQFKLGILVMLLTTGGAYYWFQKSTVYPSDPKHVVGNFSSEDALGQSHVFYQYKDSTAVIIISHGNDCPIVQQYAQTIDNLNKEFSMKGVIFLMLNSNPQDHREAIVKEAEDFNIKIPILMDFNQAIGQKLGITRTAEALLINPKGWQILYRGAIDDQMGYGGYKPKANNEFLRDAIVSLLNNEPIKVKQTQAKGCAITYSQNSKSEMRETTL